MVKKLSVAIAALLFLVSFNSFAGELSDMLQRISEADQKQNYQGTFILRKSDDLSSLRVTHGSDESGDWEMLEALNGEARKIIRRSNKVITIYPGRDLATIRPNARDESLHPTLPDNIGELERFYSIDRLQDDRIAGYQTLVIDLIPRDKLRYGYRYWLDKNTGMLLRCDLVDEEANIVEQMMFTSLEYLSEAPAQPLTPVQLKQLDKPLLNKLAAVDDNAAINDWAVNILPKGFMLTQSIVRHADITDHNELLQLVYSDGLASVSVFIEQNSENDHRIHGASSMGAVNAFGHVTDGYLVTVVGEVPMKTVQSMAKSTVKVSQ